MATWAIGDVQGCATTLERLLVRIDFSPARDRVVFCGDLVNRGAHSLEALRLVRALDESAASVLGNHDLHLLGRACGAAQRKEKDTLEDVLAAPDREELLAWLRARPFALREAGFLVVHAGLHPAWDAATAEALAREAEESLRGPEGSRFLGRVWGDAPERWEDALAPERKPVLAARILTRIRTVAADGRLCAGFSGAPVDAPRGCVPWFATPERRSADTAVVFGHWSALGLHIAPNLFGLDTGCVWGGLLTALRLEDLSIRQEPVAPDDRPRPRSS